MNCHCGKPFEYHLGQFMTLVGYSSPPGHDHDDNCRKRIYVCADGHRTLYSRRNRCPACEWVGKATCFCHPGAKIDEWPANVSFNKEKALEDLRGTAGNAPIRQEI